MKTKFSNSKFLFGLLLILINIWFNSNPLKAQDNGCLTFDGQDYLTASSTIFDQIGTGDFTIEFWMNGNAPLSSVEPILSNRGGNTSVNRNGTQGFMVFFHPEGLFGAPYKFISIQLNQQNFVIANNGTFNGDIQDGLCHHIAIVRKGQNSLFFYVDGIEIGRITGNPNILYDISAPGTTYIGYDIIDGRGFDGVLSDIRVWSLARTEAEINQNKDTYLTGNENGLVVNWQFVDLPSVGDDNSPNNFDADFDTDISTNPEFIQDCCSIIPDVCLVNTINISTGFDHMNTQLAPPGQQVGYWTLVNMPPPGAAPSPNLNLPYIPYTITPNPAWGNFSGSSWISAFENNELDENNLAPLPSYSYETYFCVSDDNSDVLFNFQALADDVVTVLLTDTQGNPLHTFGTANFKIGTVLNVNETINLDAGTYCVRGDVRNTNSVAMGFNLEGTLSGATFIDYGCCEGDGSVITGQKFHDKNCDGLYSSSELAMGLAGWEIQLSNEAGQVVDVQFTDDLGFYYFRDLPAGVYTIVEVNQPDWDQLLPGNNLYQVDLGTFEVQGGFHFGNKYTGPIVTDNIGNTCVGHNTPIQINWSGQTCDCQIEVIAVECNNAGPDIVLGIVNNVGIFNIQLGTLIGEYGFLIRDCDGNEIAVEGCINFSNNNTSISYSQVGCGEYEFNFNSEGFEVADVNAIDWHLDIEGNSSNPSPSVSFDEAGTYTISLTLTLADGCIVKDQIQLNVEQGANDDDCNFCPPHILSEVEQADLYIYDECYGMIIKSPNGSCFRVKVNDEGLLYAQGVECP